MWYMYDSHEDFSCLRKNYFHSFRHRFLRANLNVLVERIRGRGRVDTFTNDVCVRYLWLLVLRVYFLLFYLFGFEMYSLLKKIIT